MTTHDYPGDVNSPAQADAETASVAPRSERQFGSNGADPSVSPDAATDPGRQRQDDQFAADREQQRGAHSSPAETSSPAGNDAAFIGGEGLDDETRSDDQSSRDESLFAGADLEGFRREWDSVQAGFVDDPKRCVEQADGLVSAVVEQLSSGFTAARSRLEQQWSRGEDASTEDLRVALKRYREFFDRLLAV